jgi:hypothetical protein
MDKCIIKKMSNLASLIIGRWERQSFSRCCEKYPLILEFKNDGMIEGFSPGSRFHPIWDRGEFNIISNNDISISTSYDEEIVYSFRVDRNRLKFTDQEKCEIVYNKT